MLTLVYYRSAGMMTENQRKTKPAMADARRNKGRLKVWTNL